MKIFEVAGEGKLHGLTVMSLDKFVKKEDDVAESQVDEIDRRGFLKGLGAAAVAGAGINAVRNSSPTKKLYTVFGDGRYITQVEATSEKEAEQQVKDNPKFNTNNKIISAHVADPYGAGGTQNWSAPKQTKSIRNVSVGNTESDVYSKAGSPNKKSVTGASNREAWWYNDGVIWMEPGGSGGQLKVRDINYTKNESVEQGVAESDPSGIMHAAKHYNKSFLITAELAEGGKKTFRVRAQSERAAREKFAQHHNQARVISVKEQGLNEFALPGGSDGDSGRWYTDDELADIIGDDWFEDFDVSNDGFNIDTHGEKAKQNLASYANSWFDDKGYNVNVMGVDHNDVDHDLKWYIVGSFQNDNFADKDINESYQGQFKSKEEAVKYAKERVKTFRDKEDGIEVWAMPNGGFDVNHSMNSSGRNHIIDNGGKKVGTISAGSLSEAPGDFGLGANYRAIPDDEMQSLMGRSKNKQKTKRDKFDYPYIHGSNIEVKDESGKTFDTDKLRAAIMQRPERILGQNAKMQHSETGTEAIFDIGLPALKGLAVNEKTGEFVVVDTCPGAGACQTYCYAMKGSYVMFKAVSMGLARMLNFLLNDPAGFAAKLNSEIASARTKYAKKGARIVVRWHDAGDFFSPEYMDMAYSVAEANPDVGFYAYTKMGDVANAARPKNFNMNFSQGAKSGQEKKVNITRTKHSKVVPKDMFFDLIARKGNELIKDAKGRMQFASPENLDKFKTIMAQKYAIDKNSILTYDQMMKTPVGEEPKWNVIVMPGDGDNSANRNDVVGSYLLFH